MQRRDSLGRRGYTMIEVILALTVAGLAASAAVPPLLGWVRTLQARATLDRLISDVHLTRATAVRHGERAELRFVAVDGDSCVQSYRVVRRGPPERVVREVALSAGRRAPCLVSTNPNPIRFNSRGMARGFANRTLVVQRGARADSAVVSVLGRVRRSYRRRGRRRPQSLPLPASSSVRTGGAAPDSPATERLFGRAWNFPLPRHAPHDAAWDGDAAERRRLPLRHREERGFSLLEVLVALVLLGIGMAALHAAAAGAARQVAAAATETELTHRAAATVERTIGRLRSGTTAEGACAVEATERVVVSCAVEIAEQDPELAAGVAAVVVDARPAAAADEGPRVELRLRTRR